MMHAMWVQVVVIVIKTLRWRGRFSFWPSESGGARRRCSDACQEGVQTHRTGDKKRKDKQKNERERKKKKKNGLTVSLYIGFMPPMPVVSLWVEGRQRSRANHRPCAEAVGGTAQVMHAMWVQAVVVETSRWRGNLIFWPGKCGAMRGWCLGACRECAQMHRTGKKKKAKKTTKKKKGKQTYRFKPPKKLRLPQGLHVCVCVASVRAGREARGEGIRGDGIGRVFVGTLQWRRCFDFWG